MNASSTAAQPAGSSSQADKLPPGDKLTIGVLLVAAFVMILNETIMNVALRPLMEEFDVTEPTIQWLTTAFMLTLATVIPTTGYLMQRFSLRAVFTLALSLFTLGTALSAAAPGFSALLAGRVIQAGGTAIMLPLLMTTVLTLVPLHRRGVVMGNIAIVISVAPATGPALSGFILHLADWRFLFLTILPIALLSLILGRSRLDNEPGVKGKGLNIPSLLLAVPGFGGLVYGISQIGGGHGTEDVGAEAAPGVDPIAIGVLVVGVLCLIGFTLLQIRLQKTGSALLNLKPFKYQMYTRALLMMLLMMIALFGAIIMLPLFLQSVRGLNTLHTGLIMLPGGLFMALLAPFVGRLYDRIGPRPLVAPGALLLILALGTMSFVLDEDTSVAVVLGLHLVLTTGLALLFTPAFTTAMNPLPKPLYSHGSAVLNTLQQLAAAIGTALLVAVMSLGALAAASNGMSAVDAEVEGFRTAFRTAAILSIGTLLLGLRLRATESVEQDGSEDSDLVDEAREEDAAGESVVEESDVLTPASSGSAVDSAEVLDAASGDRPEDSREQ